MITMITPWYSRVLVRMLSHIGIPTGGTGRYSRNKDSRFRGSRLAHRSHRSGFPSCCGASIVVALRGAANVVHYVWRVPL